MYLITKKNIINKDKSVVASQLNSDLKESQFNNKILKYPEINVGSKNAAEQEEKLKIHESNAKKILSNIINIEGDMRSNMLDISQMDEGTSNVEQWTTAKSKKRRRSVTLGKAEVSAEQQNTAFAGRSNPEKKAWLFISRVKDLANEDIIRNYISEKLGSSNVIVKEIEMMYPRKDSKCFQIGVDFEYKDNVYNAEFWPTGVAFRRYKFYFSNSNGNFLEQKKVPVQTKI